ncbi:hypothetical protein LTR36_009627 [Oleoguttula mirabilis]|uniref:RING-type domain-containing protein n=1 Tax=Oleoguttula mirabilis TaxID=1507867 RepID=A0AAV9J6I6_9PEZI|nr:hypothetical protein LTR36_009627 [Oleoguttula mirabilis]
MSTTLPTREAFFETDFVITLDLSKTGIEKSCGICMETLSSPAKTPCGHIFDFECAKTWFDTNNTCPMCRTHLYQPSQVTPALPVHIEGMELGLSLDETAVIRSVGEFDSRMQGMEENDTFIVPPGSQVFINSGAMILEAAGAAIWLKPNVGDGDPERMCRPEWISIVQGVDRFLAEWHGRTLPAEYFLTLLTQVVWDELVWKVKRAGLPQYPAYTVGHWSFEWDLERFCDYLVFCGVDHLQSRAQ